MITYSTKTEITSQMIADQVITAFESGISYWASDANPHQPRGDKLTGRPWYSDPKLFEEDFSIEIVQIEPHKPDAPLSVWLTPQNIQSGLDLMAKKYPEQLTNIVTENGDAATADIFIQCAVFGDLIYG
jgi:hypothetical protein